MFQSLKVLLLGAFALGLLVPSPASGQTMMVIVAGSSNGSGGGGGGATCTPASGYSHCRVLTINHGQVPSTQTNFPAVALLSLGASRLQNASCSDMIITNDSAGSTKVPWEVESCSQSTGVAVVWFLVSSLSSSADTVYYVSYDNSGISTAQNTVVTPLQMSGTPIMEPSTTVILQEEPTLLPTQSR